MLTVIYRHSIKKNIKMDCEIEIVNGVDLLKASRLFTLQSKFSLSLVKMVKFRLAKVTQAHAKQTNIFLLSGDWMVGDSRASPHLCAGANSLDK